MKESCCQFGDGSRLVGIVTEPQGEGAARPVGVVLVSAGLSPKSGPFRIYAHLARRLARDGFLTLRFDLGGIGDSGPGDTRDPLERRTLREIEAALDFISERYDLNGIVLGGLCSGAEDAFRAAESDARVTGVVLVDPFGYRTLGWAWRHLAYRAKRRLFRTLFSPRRSLDAAPNRVERTKAGQRLVEYEYMDRAESSRILRAILKRGVHVHFVYTGGARKTFNHPGQLKAMFRTLDFEGLVTLNHFPRMDHTQLLQEDRARVVDAIARRLVSATHADPVLTEAARSNLLARALRWGRAAVHLGEGAGRDRRRTLERAV